MRAHIALDIIGGVTGINFKLVLSVISIDGNTRLTVVVLAVAVGPLAAAVVVTLAVFGGDGGYGGDGGGGGGGQWWRWWRWRH